MKGSKKMLNIALCLIFVVQSATSFGQNTLQAKIEQITENIKGNVGVSALIIETGESKDCYQKR